MEGIVSCAKTFIENQGFECKLNDKYLHLDEYEGKIKIRYKGEKDSIVYKLIVDKNVLLLIGKSNEDYVDFTRPWKEFLKDMENHLDELLEK